MPTTGTTRRQEEVLDGLVELFLANGFRRFTLADLAELMRCSKSTLYAFGHSKEEVVRNVLIHFFRRAGEEIDGRVEESRDPTTRIVTYLRAVADELRPASPEFFEDVAASPNTGRVYERNTQIAAADVSELIVTGVEKGAFRDVDPDFVADLVAAEMARIQTGEVRRRTGLGDAEAYDALTQIVLKGISHGAASPATAAPSAGPRRGGSSRR
jgi:AcrR family transcriptional regulator